MNRLLLKTILSIIITIWSFTNFISASVVRSVSIPEQSEVNEKTEDGAEYLIITYNEPGFINKLQELQTFRLAQGINTKIITTSEIGGNSVDTIKNYISDAYNNWDIPPNVILLVGDHDKIPGPGFQSGKKQKTDISDNYYVDIDGDDLPDITIARLPINDLFNLTNYVNRIITYETSPPNFMDYYNHPVTSMSWSDGSQNMFNAEVTNGFFNIGLNKEAVRENDLFNGTVGDSWFVETDVLNYFGPSGLNYIPATPADLTDWSGNAVNINANLNSGAFLMVNLDHGTELGWSSPEYWKSDIQGINSADPFFVISINDLNGKFNWSSDCFAEGLINHQFGAAGVIASTTNLNDNASTEYYFAMIDALWDNFIPDINSGDNIYPFVLPAFANTNAKYRLAESGLSNIGSTIYGYHYFGEPFTPIYYNFPEALNVIHNNIFEEGIQSFEVTADAESTICLSSHNSILAIGTGTGNPIAFFLDSLNCNDTLIVTVTKQNHIRYAADVVCNSSTDIHGTFTYNSIQLFPNPATDVVQIINNQFTSELVSINLYDLTGKLILKERNLSFPFQIKRQDLLPGIYFLQIETDKNIIESQKLIFK